MRISDWSSDVCSFRSGKGNDQVRFELGYYALKPDIKVIAPWREWDLTSRTKLIAFAEQHQIPIAKDKRGEAPFSVDANLLHISADGKVLEDPWVEAPDFVYSRTAHPEKAPDQPDYVEVEFRNGYAIAIQGEPLSPAARLTSLTEHGGQNGLGRRELLEDPWVEAPDFVYSRTVDPEKAADQHEYVEVEFRKGDAIAIKGETLSPAALLTRLKELGGKHGIGRLDLLENRFVGMKSRGIYETPGGTILHMAHRGIEQATLDRGAAHLKDDIMPRYAELIYNGFWFSPEREMLQALIDKSQENVEGTVRLKLYKGSVNVEIGR